MSVGEPSALEWIKRLKQNGKECNSIDLFDSNEFNKFHSAVVWHNIITDERFEAVESITTLINFIESIDINSKNLTGILDWAWLDKQNLYEKYKNTLTARGPKPKEISPSSPGYDKLCCIIKHSKPQNNNVDTIDWPLTPYFEIGRPLTWLTRLDDLKDCFANGVTNSEEALSRVGIECFEEKIGEPISIYLMVIDSKYVWDDLRVPTVIDSAFYYLFGATQKSDGPTGMTRHTLNGKGHGVPELVISNERLSDIYSEQGATAIWIKESWESEPLVISKSHVNSRWLSEIKNDINK